MSSAEVERNVAAQVEMYGEPLAAIFGRLTDGLGLTQAHLARILGMSPPMLSQLGSGKRVKIGNPAVQRRLEEVQALLGQLASGEVGAGGLPDRLEVIRTSTGSWTTTRHDLPVQGDRDATEAATVRSLLRAVASGAQLRAAAEALEPEHPALAEVLRTYGLGTPEEATAHLRRQRELF